MTVKLSEPHGYSTLTVTMTVKLTESQGCLTLNAIVAVKLRVCPLSRKGDFLPLSVPENKGCFSMLRLYQFLFGREITDLVHDVIVVGVGLIVLYVADKLRSEEYKVISLERMILSAEFGTRMQMTNLK
jgi:hypothetical protein